MDMPGLSCLYAAETELQGQCMHLSPTIHTAIDRQMTLSADDILKTGKSCLLGMTSSNQTSGLVNNAVRLIFLLIFCPVAM
jgi:hypothetical protein